MPMPTHSHPAGMYPHGGFGMHAPGHAPTGMHGMHGMMPMPMQFPGIPHSMPEGMVPMNPGMSPACITAMPGMIPAHMQHMHGMLPGISEGSEMSPFAMYMPSDASHNTKHTSASGGNSHCTSHFRNSSGHKGAGAGSQGLDHIGSAPRGYGRVSRDGSNPECHLKDPSRHSNSDSTKHGHRMARDAHAWASYPADPIPVGSAPTHSRFAPVEEGPGSWRGEEPQGQEHSSLASPHTADWQHVNIQVGQVRGAYIVRLLVM